MTFSKASRMVTLSTITLVLFSFAATAQPQAVTRMEGVVTDVDTKQPVGCKIYIYNEAGKKVSDTKSNDADGTYLVILNDAGKHKVVFGGYNVYRAEYEVVVPKSSQFQDMKQDFTVKAFVEGKQLAATIGWELNTAVLNADGKRVINDIKQALDVNQQLRVVIDVLPDQDQLADLQDDSVRAYLTDSLAYAEEYKKWEKKNKKAKVKTDPPVPPLPRSAPRDPNNDLVAQRVATIKSILNEVRNLDIRVELVGKPLPGQLRKQPTDPAEMLKDMTAKKKKAAPKTSKPDKPTHPGHQTLVVRIGKVQRLIE